MGKNIIEHIKLDYYSSTPKYRQLADSIIEAIHLGKVKRNETLPSINELSFVFEISRDTAERGYKYLKEIGVLGSVPGKGFFIKDTDIDYSLKVFLLFNNLSPRKRVIYDSIAASLSKVASIDLYIYNNDFSFFKQLLQSKKDSYTHCVIMPHFLEGEENAHEIINSIDKDKLIILDKIISGITGKFGAVYQSFEKDIYGALIKAHGHLIKYSTFKIIFPEYTYFPQEILKGFHLFCNEYSFNHKVVHDVEDGAINKGDVFITLTENDLVILIERILAENLTVGKDVGIISLNENPLKKILLNGITSMSTNFQMMGEKTAQLIMNNSKEHFAVPFHLTLRPSL